MKVLSLALLLVAAPLLAQAPAKPDTVKVSSYQLQQLLDLRTQIDELVARQASMIRTIIAGKRDPKPVEGWALQLADSILILTPPKSDSAKIKKP